MNLAEARRTARDRAGAIEHRIYRSPAVESALTRVGYAFQARLVARAADITSLVEGRRSLVVAPHPDDETLGCGATIARKAAAGTPLRVVVVADGRHANPSEVIAPAELAAIRREEAGQALARLGVAPHDVAFLEVEDTRVEAHEPAVLDALRTVFEEFRPDEVLVPAANDAHPDHRAVNRAARGARGAAGSDAAVLEYPVWFWTAKSWLEPTASVPAKVGQLLSRPARALRRLEPRTVSTDRYLEVKRHALQAHRSQLTRLSGEPDWPIMSPAFLELFLRPYELFFADRPAPATAR